MTEETTKKIIFHTNGDIDPVVWEMHGVSAKIGENRAGKFGTGACYAIAVLLRTGHQIEIFNRSNHWVFGLEAMTFRDKQFQRVTCNGKPLSFTTLYGQNWSVENAYRELVQNTNDEDGILMVGDEPMPDGTSIVVTGPDILKANHNHDQIFVGDRQPIHESRTLRIFPGNGTLFFRGIKVGELQDAHYSYEILSDIAITEDRTFANQWELNLKIGRAFCNEVKDVELLENLVTMKEGFESKCDWDNPWSTEMKETVSKMWERRPASLNKEIIRIHKQHNPTAGFAIETMDEEKELMVERAKEFLALAGYPVNARIRYVTCDDSNTIAYYYNGDIHLTERSFDKGMFELVQVLFEENSHHSGHSDYSHGFQNYLICEVISQAKRRLKFVL
jgi:hypothetical protein